MTSRGIALALAASIVVGACRGEARPEPPSLAPEPVVSESSTTSAVSTPAIDASTSTTSSMAIVPSMVEPAESSPSSSVATLDGDGPTSTTTNPTESIDIEAVLEDLDALDAMFEALDGAIGSVEFEEGEAP